MQPYEFLSYIPTPGEKHLGVVTIRCWGKIVLRYKINAGVNPGSWFGTISSIKQGIGENGKDNYEKSFVIDSSYEAEQIKKFIEKHVNLHISPQNAKPTSNSELDFFQKSDAPSDADYPY